MAHWLLKTEPHSFSIDDLQRMGESPWDGVRSYQARNNLMAMRQGDLAFVYHSSCEVPGVAGVCEVVREAYADHSAWDPNSPYHDPRSSPDRPRWFMPDVRFVSRLPRLVSLSELRAVDELEGMVLLRRGSRLSVQPVSDREWDIVLALGSN
ncbi:MAG TPA: EVE domain-containing protein [Actinomycetota bacterium]|nr:EVE domain-containing protein [Actinomycetota bacterium]